MEIRAGERLRLLLWCDSDCDLDADRFAKYLIEKVAIGSLSDTDRNQGSSTKD